METVAILKIGRYSQYHWKQWINTEKSCLKFASYFGEENDISVACCGSSLITYQVQLLLSLGIKEIAVAFDRQYKEIGDIEFKKWVAKLKAIHQKYCQYANISFVFDKKNALGYKMSPVDAGPEIFTQLFAERVLL